MTGRSFILCATLALAFILPRLTSSSTFKFTNIKCDSHDTSFLRFETCKLSIVGRGVVSLDIRVPLFKTPVTNSTINVAIYKRANGYRPFLYNVSHDVCAFFLNRNKYPVLNVLQNIVSKHSNINHTCPYAGTVVVKDLVLEESMFRHLPLPSGQYLYKILVYAFNDLKATVQLYFSCNE